ncbi:hypothetical protein DNTS_030341 [Danionella cerebrum]|uniref:Adrenomedullin n=1 Tax=Danionella cerebrum TaxID=2873325 RepID=A0A553R8I1_9TELE|nr:hypothetical protein DNTS_030341 [Danionella translucida]
MDFRQCMYHLKTEAAEEAPKVHALMLGGSLSFFRSVELFLRIDGRGKRTSPISSVQARSSHYGGGCFAVTDLTDEDGYTSETNSQIERLSPVKVIERSEVTTFLGSGTESRSLAKTDIRDDPGPGFPALLLISLHKKRVRRATPRGCQLGTCQVHNLVNKLYRMGQSNGKDPSKNANDPTGYGR